MQEENEKFEVRDFRNKQFFMMDDAYLNGYAKLCGAIATCVYTSLCRHADKEQHCFPSNELIAGEFNISRRSVYTALKKLVSHNIVKVLDQGRNSKGTFNNKIYVLLDKKNWKKEPWANISHGNREQLVPTPWANDDTNREQPLLNKDIHIKDTHIRIGLSKIKKEEILNKIKNSKKII